MKIKAVKSSQKTIRYALIGTKKELEIIIIFFCFNIIAQNIKISISNRQTGKNG